MSYSEQLEREAEQTRSQLADTLDELRACISPGQVANQIADYASDGSAGEFAHNLKNQVARNPLPVSLIGAGLAWLMFANGKAADGGTTTHRVRQRVGEVTERAGEAAERLNA